MTGTSARIETPLEALGWAWQYAGSRRADPAHSQGRDVKAITLSTSSDDRKAPRARLVTGLIVGCIALSVLALVGGFFVFVAAIVRMERQPEARADGIVALTGGSQRIDDAIELLASGHGRRLLITGVNERTSRDEIARLNPTQHHWIGCCVDLDYRARNTIGNAIETRRWMRRNHFDTIAVVTSNYHMPRTLVEIGHALDEGEAVVPYPVVPDGIDVSRWWADPVAARLLGAEYVKFLAAWLRTRFESDPEQSRFAVIVGRGQPVKMVAEPLMRETN